MDPYDVTFTTWNKLATLYQERFMDLDMYNDSYDLFCRELKKEAQVLDAGCGPGPISRYLRSVRPDLTLQGIDVAPNMIALAKANVPGVDFSVMDCRNISQLSKRFDGIICGFCIPYLKKEDCERFMRDCNALLNEDGIFYFSEIEGVYSASGYVGGCTGDKCYVYYYSEAELRAMAEAAGFQVKHFLRKHYMEFEHLIFIAEKI